MSIDQNLMGLGMPAALAVRLANAGTGPIAVTAKGTSNTTGQVIGGKQFIVFVSGSGWVVLPAVGGSDMAPEVGDDFVIHAGASGGVTVGILSGVTVNIAGTQYTGSYTLAGFHTLSLWVQSTTQWFGVAS